MLNGDDLFWSSTFPDEIDTAMCQLKKRNSNLTKRELRIRQKGTLLCQNCVGEIKKLLRKPLDRFRDRLVSFCGKASGVNRPVARSFVVEAKFLDFALFKVNGLLLS